MFNIVLNTTQIILISYFLIINLISFIIYGIDKVKARKNSKNRVSERALWFLALIGGSIGSLLAMHCFRHKTKKIEFQALLAIIITIQIIIIWLILA